MTDELQKIRKEIDAIDSQIIDLLKKRIGFVEEVGRIKAKSAKTGMSFIRSGREASMLRDLTKKIDNKFPPAAIASIWRMIISTSLNTEHPLNIAAYTSSDENCYWLAREYYGSFIDIKKDTSAENIIKNVASGEVSVGVLPIENSSWWVRPDNEKNNIYIFAKIPFIEQKRAPQSPVFAIANVIPEQTEDDVSVIAVKSDSKEQIVKIFNENNINIAILAKDNNNYLIEANKFIASSSAEITNINQKINARLLGSYAVPIRV